MLKIPTNVGTIDRLFRLIVGVVLIYISLVDSSIIQSDLIRYLLAGLGIVNVFSALTSFCPLYRVANINTNSTAADE